MASLARKGAAHGAMAVASWVGMACMAGCAGYSAGGAGCVGMCAVGAADLWTFRGTALGLTGAVPIHESISGTCEHTSQMSTPGSSPHIPRHRTAHSLKPTRLLTARSMRVYAHKPTARMTNA